MLRIQFQRILILNSVITDPDPCYLSKILRDFRQNSSTFLNNWYFSAVRQYIFTSDHWNVQVGFGSGIDWPHGSGSAIQDNELKDSDPKEIIKDSQHWFQQCCKSALLRINPAFYLNADLDPDPGRQTSRVFTNIYESCTLTKNRRLLIHRLSTVLISFNKKHAHSF